MNKMPKKTESQTRLVRDEQSPNKFTIEHCGMVGTVEQWANELEISKVTLYGRIRRMELEKALTKGKLNQAVHDPETHTKNQGLVRVVSKLKAMAAPNRFDQGKWFLLEGGKPAFQYKGSIKTIPAWAKHFGIHHKTLASRLLSQKTTIKMAVAKEIRHGTPAAYDGLKCRCEICRAANTERHRDYQQRKRGATA